MCLGSNHITVFSLQLLLMVPKSGLPLESLIDIDVIDDCGLGTLPLCCSRAFRSPIAPNANYHF